MKPSKIEGSLKDLYKRFGKSKTRASILMNDKEKAKEKMDEAFVMATQKKADLQSIWPQLNLLFSLIKDYLNGTYNDISKKTIVSIIAVILYFLSPADLIPDFILGFGLIDDVFLIGLVIKQVREDLTKYKTWKSSEA